MNQYDSLPSKLTKSALFLLVFALFLGCSAYAQSTNLGLSSGSGVQGGSVSLNLSLTADPTNPPAGLQWTFSYSATDIVSLSVTAGPALTAVSKTLSCNPTSGSITCLAMGGNSDPIGSGVVAVVGVTFTSTALSS